MITLVFFLIALHSNSSPADPGRVDLQQASAASHELLPPHDTRSVAIPRDAIEENVEEDGEEEGRLSGSCRDTEEYGPPAHTSDPQQSPFYPFPGRRHQPLRGPPAL